MSKRDTRLVRRLSALLLGIGSLFFAPENSWAGDHKPLCKKAQEADLVFEMAFEVRGHYPKEARDKQWVPPNSELRKTAKTGKVTQVFKGELETGSPWSEAYRFRFRQGAQVSHWDAFFQRKNFSQIQFLKKQKEHYRTTGWAEETAGCSSSPHFSWCKKYNSLKKQIQACLKGA